MENRKENIKEKEETPVHGLTIPHLAHLSFRIRSPSPTQAPTGGTRKSVLCLRVRSHPWSHCVLGPGRQSRLQPTRPSMAEVTRGTRSSMV